MVFDEPWYKELEAKRGFEFCVDAGYFQEFNSWKTTYAENYYPFPKNTTVIQYSGAFYPIHEGHLSVIKQAIDAVVERTCAEKGVFILHVDHLGYRSSKGSYSEDEYWKAFGILEQLFLEKDAFSYKGFELELFHEDDMPRGCSRNFTRLYSELLDHGNDAYFLCGGDRANYMLSFVDKGKCIVAGRSDSQTFKDFKIFASDRHWFIEGNDPTSSTKIRKEYNDNK